MTFIWRCDAIWKSCKYFILFVSLHFSCKWNFNCNIISSFFIAIFLLLQFQHIFQPFKRQHHKMVRHTQTIRSLFRTYCLSVFDNFLGLALKGLNLFRRNRAHRCSTKNQLKLQAYRTSVLLWILFNFSEQFFSQSTSKWLLLFIAVFDISTFSSLFRSVSYHV